MKWTDVANLYGIWVACSFAVAVAFVQALIFYRIGRKVGAEINLPAEKQNQAFRIGIINAIGPSIAVFFSLFALMSVIGGPVSWLRLSIIGSAATELGATGIAARAAGVDIASGSYSAEQLSLFWAAMGLNGMGWMLVVLFLAGHLAKLRDKIGGGSELWLGIFSSAAMMGAFGYLVSGDLLRGPTETAVAVLGVVVAVSCSFFSGKIPVLKEYTLGIAVIAGVLFGMFIG